MKSLLFKIAACMVLAAGCFAWEMPSKSFDLKPQMSSSIFAASNPTVAGDDELDLLPTASIGYGVGPSTAPTYGYTGAYDLMFDHVSQSTTAGMDSVVPYFGVGGALYIDVAPWINSGLRQDMVLMGGFNVIGPQINNLVPSFDEVWNFQTGEKQELLSLTAPFSLFSDMAVTPLKKF